MTIAFALCTVSDRQCGYEVPPFCRPSHRHLRPPNLKTLFPFLKPKHLFFLVVASTMRRSKSNPAKYARNYRSISQRRMTEHDGYNEETEMERLKAILKTSEAHLQQNENDDDDKRKRDDDNDDDNKQKNKNESAYDQDDDAIIIMPEKKKAKKQVLRIELTPQEIRRARLTHKNAARKLKQLTDRKDQKTNRALLYSKLKDSAISKQEMELLSSSSTLGKRETKREALKRLLQRERAGMTLTEQERQVLYSERGVEESDMPLVEAAKVANVKDVNDEEGNNTQTKKKKKKKTKTTVSTDSEQNDESQTTETNEEPAENDETTTMEIDEEPAENDDATIEDEEEENKSPPSAAPIDFVAQMMASMTSLKKKTDEENQKEKVEPPASELERIALEEEKRKNKVYVPINPVVVQTAATMGLEPNQDGSLRKVLDVKRPADVEAKRFDLPVSGMEYEIMDAVRNNDVVILCSETGSGKSTQAPQFLYEAGFTLGCGRDDLVIGVTQPRRVAAVSTAKRVCYEMGQGDGQSIHGKSKQGNLVAYQTRYESAGLGKQTRIKFMTDGILLQEIQSDLLLRKYGVIILDEAHERNLNTDVLLGLLSVAIPLRRKASEEEGSNIKPLKLVIMSATLRVEDFTENHKLFPASKPAVIRVPGRTHPVTIHHSRITELDDYERVAYKKVLRIHRKLPKGGILMFLTGKQEIVRTVNKLRKRLKAKEDRSLSGNKDITPADDGLRDMDDDDMDGEIFRDDMGDDFDDAESDDDDEDEEAEEATPEQPEDGDDDGIPKKVIILPLYSMLSVEEQAMVFAPVPEGYRLIVVTTNIAETSLTIPGISYVVDSGRQKCRNYHAGTGVASYDIMWISKAAADQRAGRAGRTGPGHCYRLYSSSMYARHMEDFALPEVLTRPLEDVVLAMKAMNVTSVSKFPFPTPPDQSQVDAAVKLLANLGCLDIEKVEKTGEDGTITRLGASIAKLPLGVRYGKMLLVAAQAGVLDYAIAMVAVLSENSPFSHGQNLDPNDEDEEEKTKDDEDDGMTDKERRKEIKNKWKHRGGDVLAGMLAVGAYSYAGQGAGGCSEKVACQRFCDENGITYSVMARIQKMRLHLAKLAKSRLSTSEGVAARTGGIVSSMRPPNKLQENLLCQAICSGLLDNVAMLAPPGSLSGDHPYGFRSAYISCALKEPLFMDQRSAVYTRDFRRLPQWICFDTLVRKVAKDGTPVVSIKNITPIDSRWLGPLSKGSRLLTLGEPLVSPPASYDMDKDAVVCSVITKYGSKGWEIPPIQAPLYDILQQFPSNKTYFADDSFRFFARFLLKGKVLSDLKGLKECWNDDPAVITRRTPIRKVALLVAALSSAGVDSAAALRQHWAETDRNFLFQMLLKSWTKSEHIAKVKKVWMETVKQNIQMWKKRNS